MVYLLGAGASFGSPAPRWPIPLQVGFFAAVAKHNEMLPIVHISLQRYPMPQWMVRAGYGDERGQFSPDSRLFKDASIDLERLYADVEGDNSIPESVRADLVSHLDEAIFQSVSFPVVGNANYPERTCPHYLALALRLQPADTVVSLNYDSLMDDAMLHFCPLWHPLTGYGIKFDDMHGGGPPHKSRVFPSQVELLKPHGSITFRYRDLRVLRKPEIRYIGLHNGIQALSMHMSGGWDPMIVPPTTRKEFHRYFLQTLTEKAAAAIGGADRLVVVGYSFPPADEYAKRMFAGFKGSLLVVNPHWARPDYRERVRSFALPEYRGVATLKDYLDGDEGRPVGRATAS